MLNGILLSVLQWCRLDFVQAYLACLCSLGVYLTGKDLVSCFPYIHENGDVLGVSTRKVTFAKRSSADVQKKGVGRYSQFQAWLKKRYKRQRMLFVVS